MKLGTKISSPVLWSPESPKLYKLVTTVSIAGKMVDHKETAFGIRTVGFDVDKGFLLNGKPYRIQGTCNHQDHAGVGAAIPDALQEFRIKKLKEFGCNANRTSHNPPTPELLDACDRLGMLVMDESRLLGSDSVNLKKWDDQIRRDRNHPSVAIWCIANEEFMVQDTPQAGQVARTMQDYVKRVGSFASGHLRLAGRRAFVESTPSSKCAAGTITTARKWITITPRIPLSPMSEPSRRAWSARAAFRRTTRAHGYVAAYDVVCPVGPPPLKAGGVLRRAALAFRRVCLDRF